MNIAKSFPPNAKKIRAVLPHVRGYCYCYGDTIYSPDNDMIPDHVYEHEKVHMKQQGVHPDVWWDQYLTDVRFRLLQEIEAYRVQYEYMKGLVKDRNQLDKFCRSIAHDLSSEAYGSSISFSDAMSAIRGQVRNVV